MPALRNNRQILKEGGTITTGGLQAGGILAPEQASKFLKQTFDSTPLGNLVRHEIKKAKQGKLTRSE